MGSLKQRWTGLMLVSAIMILCLASVSAASSASFQRLSEMLTHLQNAQDNMPAQRSTGNVPSHDQMKTLTEELEIAKKEIAALKSRQAALLAAKTSCRTYDTKLANQERDELFNTRVSGYQAWAQAMRKLIPTPRGAARVDMAALVLASGASTTTEAVDTLLDRFLRLPVSAEMRQALIEMLGDELGTTSLARAQTYLEDPLRMVTHLIMSTPEYQIN